MKKLAIVTTHPIQYYAPFFKLLTERGKIRPKVFYTWPQAIEGFDDLDFGENVAWDIPLLEGYEWEAVPNISRDPSSKTWRGIDCPSLHQKIKNFSPDAVLIYGWNLKSHFKVMRYFKGRIPVWFFGDSTMLDEKPGLKKILRRIWLKTVYLHADKALYVGSNNKKYFEVHGFRANQLVFFPHAIDNQRFKDNAERQYEVRAAQWRDSLGYAKKDIVITFAGKFEQKKNPFIILEAVTKINESSNRQIRLLFVGNGPLESALKMKSANLGFVKFLPFQNQSLMPVIYRIGNLYCLPSKGPGETWGLAVNEAMACHRPVLVSDRVGCAIDLVGDSATGAIFQSNSIEHIVTTLQSLLTLDLKELGNRASKLIMNWSFDKKCNAIEQDNLFEL